MYCATNRRFPHRRLTNEAQKQLVVTARFPGTLPLGEFTAYDGRPVSTRVSFVFVIVFIIGTVVGAYTVVQWVVFDIHVTPACRAVVVAVAGLELARFTIIDIFIGTLVLKRRIARSK